MIQILEFTFQSFWHWAGMVILVGAFGSSIGEAITGVRR